MPDEHSPILATPEKGRRLTRLGHHPANRPLRCPTARVVAVVIAYPPIVTHYKAGDVTIDPAAVDIQLPPLGTMDDGLQLPELGLPPLELDAPNADGQPQSTPTETEPDLSIPPPF